MSRQADTLSKQQIIENPWPLIAHHCRARLLPKAANDWGLANSWFDGWVARHLRRSGCSIFVGVETCAAKSFAAARELGITRVLDCPGIDTAFLDELAIEAASELGLRTQRTSDSPAIAERKRREMELAEVILVCSDLQARLAKEKAAPAKQVHVLPLWADTEFWHPRAENGVGRSGPLRVLFVGKINLRKGVPYLLNAAIACGSAITLTLVGTVDDELRPLLNRNHGRIRLLPPCSKIELRKLYHENDVLVLPSLGDSFGFAAMEAMACGLPVIVTENCGVPVPDPSWRVPVMNADAIAHRLSAYAMDHSLRFEHRLCAIEFARQFTPTRYRENVKEILRPMLRLAA